MTDHDAEIIQLQERLVAVEQNLLHTEYDNPIRRWLQQNGKEYEERLRKLRAERDQGQLDL